MVFKQEDIFKSIALKLCYVELYVLHVCDCNLYDANVVAEDFYAGLFSIIYDRKFHNINTEHKNAKGIDIGDDKNDMAIQITAQNTKYKITKSYAKYLDSQYSKRYKTFKIFIITPETLAYTSENYEVFNTSILLNKIKNLTDKYEKIDKYLNKHLKLEVDNQNDNFETVTNEVIIPQNMKKFLRFLNSDLDEKTVNWHKKIFNKFIEDIKQTTIQQRAYLRIIAETAWTLRKKNSIITGYSDYPTGVVYSAVKDKLPKSLKEKCNIIAKSLKQYGLIDLYYEENFGDMILFQDYDEWNIVIDLIKFALSNDIKPQIFFEKLDFSMLDD